MCPCVHAKTHARTLVLKSAAQARCETLPIVRQHLSEETRMACLTSIAPACSWLHITCRDVPGMHFGTPHEQ